MILLPNHSGTTGFICITFRTSDTTHEQVLLTNFDESNPHCREIYTTGTEINILDLNKKHGRQLKLIHIHHDCREWTTLFIEYVTAVAAQKTQLTYIINNDPKLSETLIIDALHETNSGIAVGAR